MDKIERVELYLESHDYENSCIVFRDAISGKRLHLFDCKEGTFIIGFENETTSSEFIDAMYKEESDITQLYSVFPEKDTHSKEKKPQFVMKKI